LRHDRAVCSRPTGFQSADLKLFNQPIPELGLVLEEGARKIAGVEVKSAASVITSDFRGLRKLASAAGK
jgi:hypothetical protein